MKINKLNYENFVIDYIEGTLSVELKKDFDLFLEKNEAVYEEIKDYISAPVLEESNEVYTDKKSLRRSDKLSLYILLALIPLLLLSGYFLIPRTTENIKPILKENKTQIINQFAQEENIEVEDIIEVESKSNFTKDVIKLPIQKQENKKANKKKVNQNYEVQYANNSIKQDAIYESIEPIHIVQKKEVKAAAPEFLNEIASVDVLPLNTFKTSIELEILDRAMVSLTPKEIKTKSQSPVKSSWLEMITPASFDDLDLKESLAIESNININTSRKILNAFIPESLVK